MKPRVVKNTARKSETSARRMDEVLGGAVRSGEQVVGVVSDKSRIPDPRGGGGGGPVLRRWAQTKKHTRCGCYRAGYRSLRESGEQEVVLVEYRPKWSADKEGRYSRRRRHRERSALLSGLRAWSWDLSDESVVPGKRKRPPFQFQALQDPGMCAACWERSGLFFSFVECQLPKGADSAQTGAWLGQVES